MLIQENDRTFMELAILEARKSMEIGEVPVGAVLTDGTTLLTASGNCPISTHDPTAHAEIRVIREASKRLRNYRLVGTTLYVTLEPCLMCMGAVIHSRIKRLVFGAHDPKTGAAVSNYQIGSDGRLNHSLLLEGGVLEHQCSELLKDFFREKRAASKSRKTGFF